MCRYVDIVSLRWELQCPGTEMLNLQAAVAQPGNFCCDDGACIPSQLVDIM